jgi:glyoxylate utilization-related uncharacterized protein
MKSGINPSAMKATPSVKPTRNLSGPTSPYIAQTSTRERYRFDFQNEMALIGAELRRLRTERGLSIVSAAKAAKISKYRLACMEHGAYIHFGLPDLYRLAELYGVSALDIMSVIPGANFEDIDFTGTLPGP